MLRDFRSSTETGRPAATPLRLDSPVHQLWPVQFAISDFGSEMQDSSNFKISHESTIPPCEFG
jgi:hypothetical protein